MNKMWSFCGSTPVVLTNPFPSQQQLIYHMSNHGNSSSSEEIHMMSSETINLQTRSHNYEKPADKKEDNSSSDKSPPTGFPTSSSNGPLTIEKPNLDMILRLPKSTLMNFVFNYKA